MYKLEREVLSVPILSLWGTKDLFENAVMPWSRED